MTHDFFASRCLILSLVSTATLAFLTTNSPTMVESALSSPDVGYCVSVENGSLIYLDCLSGEKNFCCSTKQVETFNKVKRWAKRCCSEDDFVKENW